MDAGQDGVHRIVRRRLGEVGYGVVELSDPGDRQRLERHLAAMRPKLEQRRGIRARLPQPPDGAAANPALRSHRPARNPAAGRRSAAQLPGGQGQREPDRLVRPHRARRPERLERQRVRGEADLRMRRASGVEAVEQVLSSQRVLDDCPTLREPPVARPAALARLGPREIVISDRDQPVWAMIDGEEHCAPVPRVTVRNAAGAGDALAGAYLAARLERRPGALALAWAVAASSLSVQRDGCAGSYPTREQTRAEAERLASTAGWGAPA